MNDKILCFTTNDKMSSLIDRRHFQSGMQELVNFANSLLESQTDHRAIEQVQRHIERASHEMQVALEVANGELKSVDNQSMKLVAEKKKMEDEKSGQNQQLSYYRNQLASYKSSESNSTNMLEAAESHLKKMNCQLEAKRDDAKQSEIVRNVGIGLMAAGMFVCPVVSTIAGSVFIGCCQVALNEAEKAKEKAEEAVERHRKEVSKYKAETSKLSSLIWNAENKITRTENRIQLIMSEQHSLALRQAEIIPIQDVLRKCVNFLGILAGKVSVTETLCRDIFIYEELENVFEDILQHVYPLMGPGNMSDVLSSAEIRGLIWKLKSTRERLHALTYRQASNAISYFH